MKVIEARGGVGSGGKNGGGRAHIVATLPGPGPDDVRDRRREESVERWHTIDALTEEVNRIGGRPEEPVFEPGEIEPAGRDDPW